MICCKTIPNTYIHICIVAHIIAAGTQQPQNKLAVCSCLPYSITCYHRWTENIYIYNNLYLYYRPLCICIGIFNCKINTQTKMSFLNKNFLCDSDLRCRGLRIHKKWQNFNTHLKQYVHKIDRGRRTDRRRSFSYRVLFLRLGTGP